MYLLNMALDVKLYISILIFISMQCSAILTNNTCSSMMCPYPTVCENGSCICREGFMTSNCTQLLDTCYCPFGEECQFGNCSCDSDSVFTCTKLPSCGTNFNITCKYNGTCVNMNNKPYCICPATISSKTDCTPNRCDDNPCPIGSCIPRGNDDYDCLCPRGGVGKNCSIDRKCTDEFCSNGGICYEYNNQYAKCKCKPGYSGLNCEENMTLYECDIFGILSGTTKNITNDTTCMCKKGFKGRICNLLDCKEKNPCTNGLCYPNPISPVKYSCVCPSGWTGDLCDADVNECSNSPCTNNGTCSNIQGSFMCHCPDNTTGQYCKSKDDSCMHRETCMTLANDGTCNAICNDIHCDFDGGDCILNTDPWNTCRAMPGFCKSLSGNKMCNQECNNEACLFDLLDCKSKPIVECPQICKNAWGDGRCQSKCNTFSCGFDGTDCGERPENTTIGTMIITFISQSSDAYKTIGRVLSVNSETVISFKDVTTMSKHTSMKPFELVSQNTSLQYIAFYEVGNSESCPSNDTLCWTDTEPLSKFAAALFTQNNSVFQHDMIAVTIKNVQACMIGDYGENCEHKCGKCDNTIGCNLADGSCPNGCMESYWGNKCDQPCSSYCLKGCEETDGNCTDGACTIGYQGARCFEKCDDGRYGMNCMYNCSVNCKMGMCDNVNGTCQCIAGHKGDMCKLDCEKGTYGVNCNGHCGHCFNNEPCNTIDGSCPAGCISGYTGKNCDFKCMKGKYGKGCVNVCSNCDDGGCDPASGKCLRGCKLGWKGDTCMTAAQGKADNSTIIAVVIVLAVLVVLGIVVAVILWKRNQQRDYILAEKAGPEMTPMKNVKKEEPLNNTNGDIEPLVAATPNDKNFPDAKLVLENEGVDLDNKEEKDLEEEEKDLVEEEKDLVEEEKETKTPERTSKTSDFRPDSIHGNGPGGVYVGSNLPVTGDTDGKDMEDTIETSETNESKNSSENVENINSNQSRDEKDKRNTAENKEESPLTTVNDSGVINTDKL